MADKRLELISDHQQMLLHALRCHLAPGQKYALVDFPDHPNVGDSAIWVGEIALMNQVAGAEPTYVSRNLNDFNRDELIRKTEGGPIFIHGGGNFGDIWPRHQMFRNHLLETFKGRDIIQLPQSVHFDHPHNFEETARLIEGHGRFHMMVRDVNSFEQLAKANCRSLELLPDSAFGIGPLPYIAGRKKNILFLLRTDKEKVNLNTSFISDIKNSVHRDWLQENHRVIKAIRLSNKFRSMFKSGDGSSEIHLCNDFANNRVNRGLKILRDSHFIVTDRLHVHILSTLLGIRHVVLDNYYGKISSYMDKWTGSIGLAQKAATFEEAVEIAKTV